MRVPGTEAKDESHFDFILNNNAQILARALILYSAIKFYTESMSVP